MSEGEWAVISTWHFWGKTEHAVSITTSEGTSTWKLSNPPHYMIFRMSEPPRRIATNVVVMNKKYIKRKQLSEYDDEIREKFSDPTYGYSPPIKPRRRRFGSFNTSEDISISQHWSDRIFNYYAELSD